MKFIKFSMILLAASLSFFACSRNEPTKTNVSGASNNFANTAPAGAAPSQPTPQSNELASAKKIYSEKCARCHKEDGSGGKTNFDGTIINAENLTTDKQKKESDADYIEAVEKGFPEDGMPGFKGKLTDQEIKDVVKYIRKEIQNQ